MLLRQGAEKPPQPLAAPFNPLGSKLSNRSEANRKIAHKKSPRKGYVCRMIVQLKMSNCYFSDNFLCKSIGCIKFD